MLQFIRFVVGVLVLAVTLTTLFAVGAFAGFGEMFDPVIYVKVFCGFFLAIFSIVVFLSD